MDDNGELLGPGQRGEMVIRGPLVMAGYYKDPAVQDCAVIGLPDEKWGERVTAVVQLRPGQAVTEDHMRAFVKDTSDQSVSISVTTGETLVPGGS